MAIPDKYLKIEKKLDNAIEGGKEFQSLLDILKGAKVSGKDAKEWLFAQYIKIGNIDYKKITELWEKKYEDYNAALQCSRNLRIIQETLKERVGRDSGSFAIRIRDEEPEIIKIALQKEKERIDSRQKAREKMDSEDWADRMDEYYMNRAFAPEREGSVDISPPPRYGVNEKDAPRLLNVLNKAIKTLKDDGMELEFEKGSFGIKRINTRPHRVNPITSVVAINISIGDLKEIGKPVEYTGKELKFKN